MEPPRSLRTATPTSIREVNRSILLDLIRRLQPISRAELSRRTGIFRSNISKIVDKLLEEGLLEEQRAVPSGRGKVPMLLRLRDDFYQVFGIYVQPVHTTMAFSGFGGQIRKTWSFTTPEDPARFAMEVCRMIETIRGELSLGENGIQQIGLGVPGLVNAATGKILWVPALSGYSEFPLAEELERLTGVPVVLDNDCNLGALSEMHRAQRSENGGPADFVFLSIGDHGVGAGVILGGELYRGHDYKFAAEFGHMVIDPSGPLCGCGRNGCWEKYICNEAVWRRYKPRTQFQGDRFSALISAAVDGEQGAMQVIQEAARYIALGASNIAFALNPAEIVLAGKITEAWPIIQTVIESVFSSLIIKVRIRRSWFKREIPLLHGAVYLALSKATTRPRFGLQTTSL